MSFLQDAGWCLGTDLHQRCMDFSFSSVYILDDTRSYMTTMQCLLLSLTKSHHCYATHGIV